VEKGYRQLLKDIFFQRRIRNPSYSLRSFARDIGVAPSNLSLVLRSKKGISGRTARSISERLPLSPVERQLFNFFVEKEHSKNSVVRKNAELEISRVNVLKTNLSNDFTRTVAGWVHFAVMEALRLPYLHRDSLQHIARALSLDTKEVSRVIQDLLSAQLITGVVPTNWTRFRYINTI